MSAEFQRCRVCGCTDTDACAGGCCWVEEDLCSVCAVAAEQLADWIDQARRACLPALLREVGNQVSRRMS